METSSLGKWRDKWRDHLRDETFWLGGYRHTDEYRTLEDKLYGGGPDVHWNVGVGPAASFTRAISRLALEVLPLRWAAPDHVIKVQLIDPEEKDAGGRFVMSMEKQLVATVAEELGLPALDQKYRRLKHDIEEIGYFSWWSAETYEMYNEMYAYLDRVVNVMYAYLNRVVPHINAALSIKRYLLVVENLYQPIMPGALTYELGLPPANRWPFSDWVISAASREVCNKSMSQGDTVYESFSDDEIMVLILFALNQSAKHISKAVGQEDNEEHWRHVTLQCFHYALLLFPQCHEPPDADDNSSIITKEELIRQWAAQGFLTTSKPGAVQEDFHSKGINHHDDVYQVGNIILQTFQDYSLLNIPFPPATEDDEATKTAAHFLSYHGLVADHLKKDDIFHEEQWLQNKRWIKLACNQEMEDQGWYIRTKLASKEEEPNGTTTALILRGYSNKSSWFTKLNHLLPKLPNLLVLDLSYTPIESVPPSVWCLPNIKFLSLRGCYNLKTLSNFSNSERTASKEVNTKINLLYLDLSYSSMNSFHCATFHNMPNLQELVLVKCNSLVDLPPSIAALSSLSKLEVTGTQIKYFPKDIFKEMQNLQSLKLIDNKRLMSVSESICRAYGLIELHIEGLESTIHVEIMLPRHPTLKSFLLINAPHIRHLSLQGCRKLERVDLRDLSALEDLDLSATAIKELPVDIPNLPQLKRLLLIDVPSLSRFPWHRLQRFPDVFCLDHCTKENDNYYDDQVAHLNRKVAHVCVEDSRLFYSFSGITQDLVQQGEFLQSFYVQVAPCRVNIRRLEDERDILANKLQEVAQKKSPYSDVYRRYMAKEASAVPTATPPVRQTTRHVEIFATDRYPHGLEYLLKVIKSISVTDDTYVSSLTNLSNDLNMLEDCKLRLCHQMTLVFYYGGSQALQNAWLSQLKSLIHFYQPWVSSHMHDFSSLKHLHLEYCPRLESIMPRVSALPSLTTLDILFCYNLKTIFYQHPTETERVINYELPSLRRMRLQELPLLRHLRDDINAIISTPAWKELHVRGCWSLRRLPHLCRENPSQVVEVSGERAWWRKLIWDSDSPTTHRDNYQPKLPQAFASFDERAPVTSYIR